MHRVDGLFFDYGIFLNISNDHIGPNEHASFEEYLYYKKQLLKTARQRSSTAMIRILMRS